MYNLIHYNIPNIQAKNEECQNIDGGYSCECATGYERDLGFGCKLTGVCKLAVSPLVRNVTEGKSTRLIVSTVLAASLF